MSDHPKCVSLKVPVSLTTEAMKVVFAYEGFLPGGIFGKSVQSVTTGHDWPKLLPRVLPSFGRNRQEGEHASFIPDVKQCIKVGSCFARWCRRSSSGSCTLISKFFPFALCSCHKPRLHTFWTSGSNTVFPLRNPCQNVYPGFPSHVNLNHVPREPGAGKYRPTLDSQFPTHHKFSFLLVVYFHWSDLWALNRSEGWGIPRLGDGYKMKTE